MTIRATWRGGSTVIAVGRTWAPDEPQSVDLETALLCAHHPQFDVDLPDQAAAGLPEDVRAYRAAAATDRAGIEEVTDGGI